MTDEERYQELLNQHSDCYQHEEYLELDDEDEVNSPGYSDRPLCQVGDRCRDWWDALVKDIAGGLDDVTELEVMLWLQEPDSDEEDGLDELIEAYKVDHAAPTKDEAFPDNPRLPVSYLEEMRKYTLTEHDALARHFGLVGGVR